MIKFLKGLMKKKKAKSISAPEFWDEIPVPVVSEPKKSDDSHSNAKKDLEEALSALKELNELISGSGMKVQGLEEFLKSSSSEQVVPFTAIENFNDATKEMYHHSDMYEMMTDSDLVEELINFHNKGYEIPGLVELYKKLERDEEFTETERRHLEQSYMLIGMELVYNV